MRSYPRNSPEAAARIVALALIADGHVCRSELEALQAKGVEAALGLAPGGFAKVTQTLCEDLLCASVSFGPLTSSLDDEVLEALVRDVDDHDLQRKVLAAIAVAAEADEHLADGERHLLATMVRMWRHSAGALVADTAT